jgi:hypothetical protein
VKDRSLAPVLGLLGLLAAVAALALVGRLLEQNQLETGDPPASITPLGLIEPVAGARYMGTGLVPVSGRAPPGTRSVTIEATAAGVTIGSTEVRPSAEGTFEALLRIVPPRDGGGVVIEAVADAGDRVAVDIELERANALILWEPTSRAAVEGDALALQGFVLPPVAAVGLDLSTGDGILVAEANVRLKRATGAPPGPWNPFSTSMRIPPATPPGCLRLEATAIGSAERILFSLDMPLTLAGPSAQPCP